MPQTSPNKFPIGGVIIGLAVTGAIIFTIFFAASKGWKVGAK